MGVIPWLAIPPDELNDEVDEEIFEAFTPIPVSCPSKSALTAPATLEPPGTGLSAISAVGGDGGPFRLGLGVAISFLLLVSDLGIPLNA